MYIHLNMIIHKTFSKTDLIEIIIDLGLPVVYSHQDNKNDIHQKLKECLKKDLQITENFYKIQNKDELINYLEKQNQKKILTIKEKDNVMKLCKKIIQYCKSNYDITVTDYLSQRDIIDDLDYIKQFGDIPSVRRCCKLMNQDVKCGGLTFKPLISPKMQKELDEKKKTKEIKNYSMTVKYATDDSPIVLYFD